MQIPRVFTNLTPILDMKAVFVIPLRDRNGYNGEVVYFLRETEIFPWSIAVRCEALPVFYESESLFCDPS